jgi:hypothetical protein
MSGTKVVAAITEFNHEFERLKDLLDELKRYETDNSKE